MKKIINYLKNNYKTLIASILVISLFIYTSWLSREHADVISNSAFSNVYGEIVYFFISILAVMVAGITSSPLIPLANIIWGPALTVVLTASGWTIGSVLAFLLSRKYGEKLICKLINKCNFDEYRNRIKTKGLFWHLLLARIFLPVDVISYAVGLFTNMNWLLFALSTLIGSTIFATLAVLATSLSMTAQIVLSAIIIFVFFARIQKFARSLFTK